MRKRNKVFLLCLTILMACCLCFGVAACGGNGEPEKKDPVITLSGNIPASGLKNVQVTLPTATAKDYNGKDVAVYVNVTVHDSAGTAVGKPVNNKNAATAQTFVPNGTETKFKIVYTATDSEGKKAEKSGDFTMLINDTKSVISLGEFNLTAGITVDAADGFSLPAFTVTYEGNALTDKSPAYFAVKDAATNANNNLEYAEAFGTDGAAKKLFASKGTYTVSVGFVYGGIEADKVSFPLSVTDTKLNGKNLLTQPNSITGFHAGDGSTDARVNDYEELEVGKSSHGIQDSNKASAALRFRKAGLGDTVGISFNIDPSMGAGADEYFTINYISTSTGSRMDPDGGEGRGASMLFRLQIATSTAQVYGEGDNRAGTTYSAVNLRDGKDHTLYMRLEKTGASAQASGAALVFKVWVDVPVTGAETFSARVTRSDNAGPNVMSATNFDKLFNETGDEGWINFGSFSGNTVPVGGFKDDVMRVKGAVIYPAATTNYNTDITAPVVAMGGALDKVYPVGEKSTFPVGSSENGVSVVGTIYKADGTKVCQLDTNWQSAVLTEGKYTIVYTGRDAAGNLGHIVGSFVVTDDNVAPDLTLSGSNSSAFTAKVGTAFTLPTAAATDAVEGNLTSQITLSVEGPDFNDSIKISDNTWTVFAPGTYSLVYTVSDSSLNTTTKKVTFTVTDETPLTGNLLTKLFNKTGSATVGEPALIGSGRKISSEKVGFVWNYTKSASGLVQVAMRGNNTNASDWANGFVLTFNNGGDIIIYGNGHNNAYVGKAENPYNLFQNVGVESLIEYQVTQETVAGADWLHFRVWFNGNELSINNGVSGSKDAAAYKEMGGTADESDKGIFISLSDSTYGTTWRANSVAGYPFFSAHNGAGATLKDIEFNVSDPHGYEVEWEQHEAAGMAMPSVTGTGLTPASSDTVTVVAGDSISTIATNQKAASSTASKIVLESVTMGLQFKLKDGKTEHNYAANPTLIRFTGDKPANQWNNNVNGQGVGMNFYAGEKGQREIMIEFGGVHSNSFNNKFLCWVTEGTDLYTYWENGTKFYINYTIAYTAKTDGYIDKLSLTMYYSTDGETWKDVPLYYPQPGSGASLPDGLSESNTIILNPELNFANVAEYSPSGIYAQIFGNGADGSDNANFNLLISDVKAESVTVS